MTNLMINIETKGVAHHRNVIVFTYEGVFVIIQSVGDLGDLIGTWKLFKVILAFTALGIFT